MMTPVSEETRKIFAAIDEPAIALEKIGLHKEISLVLRTLSMFGRMASIFVKTVPKMIQDSAGLLRIHPKSPDRRIS
jgi:hypothetical protein